MTPLCELALKYHTDKGPLPNWPHSQNYTPYYHELFGDKRNSVTSVFEMGLGLSGRTHPDYPPAASLRMWREYFPNAQIYGADISPDALLESDGIRSFLCDQSSTESLRHLVRQLYDCGCTGFDLIVDDGTHALVHQTLTAQALHPLLIDGGVYIIEDFERGDAVDLRAMGFKLIEPPNSPGCLMVATK